MIPARLASSAAALTLAAAVLAISLTTAAQQADPQTDLPNVRHIPAVEVIPLPGGEASFRFNDRELTRYRFGTELERPYWYPIMGPGERSLTRIGHPHGPDHHGHHHSVWIAHQKVDDASFWEIGNGNRIVCRGVRRYEDGDESAWMISDNDWLAGERVVLKERRRCEVRPVGGADARGDAWFMIVDMELAAPGDEPVTLGDTPFGMFAVRLAKWIGEADGGGRLLDSEGRIGEDAVFRKPAKWVDYSGRADRGVLGGITLLDHPTNPSHPTPFHVRRDGWMGASLTHGRPITIEPGKPLRLRYALYVHPGVVDVDAAEKAWRTFADWPLAPMK